MIKSHFTEKDERASEVLGLIHIGVCEPMNTNARDRYYYFIIFTNDLWRYGHIYLMTHKLESFEMSK